MNQERPRRQGGAFAPRTEQQLAEIDRRVEEVRRIRPTLTQAELAAILGIGTRAVRKAEARLGVTRTRRTPHKNRMPRKPKRGGKPSRSRAHKVARFSAVPSAVKTCGKRHGEFCDSGYCGPDPITDGHICWDEDLRCRDCGVPLLTYRRTGARCTPP